METQSEKAREEGSPALGGAKGCAHCEQRLTLGSLGRHMACLAAVWPQFRLRNGSLRTGLHGDREGKRGPKCFASLLAVAH